MTTPTLSGIAKPDRLDIRFGTLHFLMVPRQALDRKLYDNLVQCAVQIYLLAIPAVSQAANPGSLGVGRSAGNRGADSERSWRVLG
jgi:hypothetical protein